VIDLPALDGTHPREQGLRIAIDARVTDAESGGVPSVIMGLAHGLSGLEDGDEQYLFVVLEGHDSWLRPYLGGPCKALQQPVATTTADRLKQGIGRVAPVARTIWERLPIRIAALPAISRSSGLVESAGVDIMHFPMQSAFLTRIPSIYHPHDLQHIHLPEYFSSRGRARRDRDYRVFAQQAAMVAVASTWTKLDVARNLGVPEARIVVVPWAPPLAAVAEPTPDEAAVVSDRLGLPARFIMYPARTWPHKNHAALIDAVALLRRRDGIDVPLVFTGHRTPFASELDGRARRLAVDDLLTWTGFLNGHELRAVYSLADGVVIPSRFEAASAPLWEAWMAGSAAACSNVTSLPEQAGDAALVFDPTSVDAVTDAVAKLWLCDDLRTDLVRRGQERVSSFTWERSARTFRAHYRRIAGRALSDEDKSLISAEAGI
jgi:glycosyltransferase involved in cell wall biosynthesis